MIDKPAAKLTNELGGGGGWKLKEGGGGVNLLCAQAAKAPLPISCPFCANSHRYSSTLDMDQILTMDCCGPSGNAMHAVRTQCEVLDVGKYSNPSFGPFSQASVEAVRFALQSTLPDR